MGNLVGHSQPAGIVRGNYYHPKSALTRTEAFGWSLDIQEALIYFKFKFWVRRVGNPTGNLVVRFEWASAGVDPDAYQIEEATNIPLSQIPTSGWTGVEFPFFNTFPYEVDNSGPTLKIHVRFDGTLDGSNYIEIASSTTEPDNWADVVCWDRAGGWSVDSTNHYLFVLLNYHDTFAVPKFPQNYFYDNNGGSGTLKLTPQTQETAQIADITNNPFGTHYLEFITDVGVPNLAQWPTGNAVAWFKVTANNAQDRNRFVASLIRYDGTNAEETYIYNPVDFTHDNKLHLSGNTVGHWLRYVIPSKTWSSGSLSDRLKLRLYVARDNISGNDITFETGVAQAFLQTHIKYNDESIAGSSSGSSTASGTLTRGHHIKEDDVYTLNSSTDPDSTTRSHTLKAGVNRAVFAFAIAESNLATGLSCTYGGQSMTKVAHAGDGNNSEVAFFILWENDLPTNGANDCVLSHANYTGGDIILYVGQLYDVVQSIDDFDTNYLTNTVDYTVTNTVSIAEDNSFILSGFCTSYGGASDYYIENDSGQETLFLGAVVDSNGAGVAIERLVNAAASSSLILTSTYTQGDQFRLARAAIVFNPTSPGSIVGSSAGSSLAIGSLDGKGSLYGSSSGSCSVSGTLQADGQLIGSSAGQASPIGILVAKGQLVGSSTGISTVSGTLIGDGALISSAGGTSVGTGVLIGSGALIGSSAGQASVSGALNAQTSLSGSVSGSSSVSGTLQADGQLIGSSAGSASASGTLQAKGQLVGSFAGIASASGTLQNAVSQSGSSQGSSTAEGVLTAKGQLVGASVGQAVSTAVITAKGQLVGLSEGSSSAVADLVDASTLSGATGGSSIASGLLVGKGELIGSSAGSSSALLNNGTIREIVILDCTITQSKALSGTISLTKILSSAITKEKTLNCDING